MSHIRQHRTLSLLVIAFSFLSSVQAGPLRAIKQEETPEVLLERASGAEKNAEWEKALENYLKAFLAGRQTPAVRERIRVCQHRLAQHQRQRDAAFQEHLGTLTAADSLNLYAEVVERLNAIYIDREKVRPEKLFRAGLDELDRALQDSTFQKSHLAGATPERLTKARKQLQESWATKSPKTMPEMRLAVQQLVRTLQSQLEVQHPAAVVFELMCGASNTLDEHTIYLSPFQALASSANATETVQEVSILSMKDGIGYIKLATFTENTPGELDEALTRLRDQGARSLILDLRGNAGGNFLAALQTAQRFIPSGILASTQSRTPEFSNRIFMSDSGMMALDLPIVLLIDTKTMSSAEIFASAFKDNSRATIIGMPTFGKGVLQYPFKLSAADVPDLDGSVHSRSGTLVVTIAKAMTSRGTAIQGHGVLPDVLESDTTRQLTLARERAAALVGMR